MMMVAQQLSYAEQDEAIHKSIRMPWRPRVRLPHVQLAWRLRLLDPGSAPVPGESIEYVITNNGGVLLSLLTIIMILMCAHIFCLLLTAGNTTHHH